MTGEQFDFRYLSDFFSIDAAEVCVIGKVQGMCHVRWFPRTGSSDFSSFFFLFSFPRLLESKRCRDCAERAVAIFINGSSKGQLVDFEFIVLNHHLLSMSHFELFPYPVLVEFLQFVISFFDYSFIGRGRSRLLAQVLPLPLQAPQSHRLGSTRDPR